MLSIVVATRSPDFARTAVDLAAMLAERFPDDPLTIPHRVWAVIARAPAP